MTLTSLLPYTVCLSVGGAIWLLLNRFGRRDETAERRLDVLRRENAEKFDGRLKHVPGFKNNAVPGLAGLMTPRDQLQQTAIKQQLSYAGFNQPHAIVAYLAVKSLMFICGGLIGLGTGISVWGIRNHALIALLTGAALGILLPGLVLRIVGNRRRERIFMTLPGTLDLMVICIEVGKGLDAAIQEVTTAMQKGAPEVCEEFALYSTQRNLGMSRHDALHHLGTRCGVEDMNSLATVLIQADRFGNSIATTLRELGEAMRHRRRQLAEERAQKTAVKLLFPLVLFIFPGIFVVLVGPAAISLINDFLSL